MQQLDDAGIDKLANDFALERVFFSTQLGTQIEHLLQTVFMPLLFIDEKTRKQLVKENVCVFYEYYDKAGPRGVNGFPMFTSMFCLDEETYKKVVDKAKKKIEALKSA